MKITYRTNLLLGAFAIAMALMIVGCVASSPPAKGQIKSQVKVKVKKDKSATADAYLIKGVPLIPQSKHMCGPATLAMVFKYYGDPLPIADITNSVYLKKAKGTLTIDMLLFAKERGYSALHYDGTPQDIKDRIISDKPPIVLLDLGIGRASVWHYAVVVGFDDARGGNFFLHAGKNKVEKMSYKRFLKAWTKSGNSILVISPS